MKLAFILVKQWHIIINFMIKTKKQQLHIVCCYDHFRQHQLLM